MLAGGNAGAVQRGLDSFTGVRDRMEVVGIRGGVTYINDTTATAPVAAAAALTALEGIPGKIHLLAGGADKNLDPTPLAVAAARSGAAVYLFNGTATAALTAALRAQQLEPVGIYDSMREAVTAATNAAGPGDSVLLSPGCASFGLFRDEFDRGEQFRQVFAEIAAARAEATHG
jgi:UDP-N-acetylmuramoylalanine--D-glutamate ligase